MNGGADHWLKRGPLFSEDSAEQAQFLKLFVRLLLLGGPLLLVGEGMAVDRGWINGWVFLLLVLFDPVILYLAAWGLFWLMDRAATGFTTMVYAGGGHPLEPAHSGIESLTARGFYPQAAEAWRSHLEVYPGDHAARLKLADLYHRHLENPAAAEALYLAVRRGSPAAKEDRLASNLLIDLYRTTGRTDRQMVELARFAARWKGTQAGADAARVLHDLKQDLTR
jgi:hypothetical protein